MIDDSAITPEYIKSRIATWTVKRKVAILERWAICTEGICDDETLVRIYTTHVEGMLSDDPT